MDNLKEELADKIEIIRAMAEFNGFALEEVIETANLRWQKKVAFKKDYF